ncbi:hypothetical protein GE09DRAFT_74305 [Coniochaeta sp. 2T2.1]|nr:hypothetical protein GE09DRAFT_74305 [Coniochaeta sp. 2T2.1]
MPSMPAHAKWRWSPSLAQTLTASTHNAHDMSENGQIEASRPTLPHSRQFGLQSVCPMGSCNWAVWQKTTLHKPLSNKTTVHCTLPAVRLRFGTVAEHAMPSCLPSLSPSSLPVKSGAPSSFHARVLPSLSGTAYHPRSHSRPKILLKHSIKEFSYSYTNTHSPFLLSKHTLCRPHTRHDYFLPLHKPLNPNCHNAINPLTSRNKKQIQSQRRVNLPPLPRAGPGRRLGVHPPRPAAAGVPARRPDGLQGQPERGQAVRQD